MASMNLEDCSQTLELNVIIKDEEEEEEIGTSVSHGNSRFYLQCIRKVFRPLDFFHILLLHYSEIDENYNLIHQHTHYHMSNVRFLKCLQM
jgi:hypothetical protein